MIMKKYKVEKEILVKILMDESKENFKFDDGKLSWKEFYINNHEIDRFRKENFISYGSCSFDEPREDLKELGIF